MPPLYYVVQLCLSKRPLLPASHQHELNPSQQYINEQALVRTWTGPWVPSLYHLCTRMPWHPRDEMPNGEFIQLLMAANDFTWALPSRNRIRFARGSEPRADLHDVHVFLSYTPIHAILYKVMHEGDYFVQPKRRLYTAFPFPSPAFMTPRHPPMAIDTYFQKIGNLELCKLRSGRIQGIMSFLRRRPWPPIRV